MDADPGVEIDFALAAELLAERFESFEHPQTGAGGASRGVLEGDRKAEAGEKSLLVALHDGAAEFGHCLFADLAE